MKKIVSILLVLVLALSLVPTAFAASKGDINGDGNVSSADALMVLQYSVGQIRSIDKTKADVNKDGAVNSADALIILQICVGLVSGFDMPKTVKDTVALYNSALKSTYGKDKMTLIYTYRESGTTTDITDNKSTPYNDSISKNVECQNGKYKSNGTRIESLNPGFALDYNGVSSATIKDAGNGKYVIKITLKEEKTDIFKMPVYNKQAALPFVYTDEATSGTTTYTGTTLELIINNNSDALALTLKMPYICEYKSIVSGKSHSMKDTGSIEYTANYSF